MTQATDTLRLAQQYLDHSNAHDLEAIYASLDEAAVYSSNVVGDFTGKAAIRAMMAPFFAKYKDVHWEVWC
jgi:hypothetical protein